SSDEKALVRESQAELKKQQTHRNMLLATLFAVAFLAIGVGVYAVFSHMRARSEERFRAAIETIKQGNGSVAVDTSQGRLTYNVNFATQTTDDAEQERKREGTTPELRKEHFQKTGYTLDLFDDLDDVVINRKCPVS